MRIVVDTNGAETALHGHIEGLQKSLRLKEPSLVVERTRLDVGDVRVSTENDERVFLFERKRWSDWASSMVDGRYREQKGRFLASSDANTILVYIIEDARVTNDRGHTGGVSNLALNAALLKTTYRDGISVIHTSDAAHTAWAIVYLARELHSGKLSLKPSTAHSVGLVGTASKRKREHREHPPTCYRHMLSCIIGMSDVKATAVAAEFPNLALLKDATENDLSTLTCSGRKLGPAIAKRIRAVFECDVV